MLLCEYSFFFVFSFRVGLLLSILPKFWQCHIYHVQFSRKFSLHAFALVIRIESKSTTNLKTADGTVPKRRQTGLNMDLIPQ